MKRSFKRAGGLRQENKRSDTVCNVRVMLVGTKGGRLITGHLSRCLTVESAKVSEVFKKIETALFGK